MSTNNTQHYKLASIVDNFMIENDLPGGWFNKCLLWAIRGLRELRLDTWQDVSTKVFEVSDNNTITLPSDFVAWVVVSSYSNPPNTLGVNSSLIPPFEESYDPQRAETDLGYYLTNFGNGAIFSYGLAVSTKGSFRLLDNGTCKQLIMDLPSRHDKVYLEYITDGFNPCGETIIHPYLYDYLIKYMDFKYEEKNNPKATEASIYRKGENLHWAEKRVRARRNNLDPQTLLNITRQYTTLALKI